MRADEKSRVQLRELGSAAAEAARKAVRSSYTQREEAIAQFRTLATKFDALVDGLDRDAGIAVEPGTGLASEDAAPKKARKVPTPRTRKAAEEADGAAIALELRAFLQHLKAETSVTISARFAGPAVPALLARGRKSAALPRELVGLYGVHDGLRFRWSMGTAPALIKGECWVPSLAWNLQRRSIGYVNDEGAWRKLAVKVLEARSFEHRLGIAHLGDVGYWSGGDCFDATGTVQDFFEVGIRNLFVEEWACGSYDAVLGLAPSAIQARVALGWKLRSIGPR